MLILVLLGMYFDAALVFVMTFLLLFRLALDILSLSHFQGFSQNYPVHLFQRFLPDKCTLKQKIRRLLYHPHFWLAIRVLIYFHLTNEILSQVTAVS